MPTPRQPVEFTRITSEGNVERVGNIVAIEGGLEPFLASTNAVNLIPNGLMQTVTVTDAVAVGFAAFPADTTHVEITFAAGSIAYTIDGVTTPTTGLNGIGHLVRAEANTIRAVDYVDAMQMIAVTSLDGIVTASPLKRP